VWRFRKKILSSLADDVAVDGHVPSPIIANNARAGDTY
jgi:hypothetical protein